VPFEPRSRLAALLVAGSAAAAMATAPPRTWAQPASAPLVLEAALVRPSQAAPDTLCHLEARIANAGNFTASSFAFRLELDDQDVGAYRDHLFMDPVAPGETRTLALFSFWTNETGRPLPASGALSIELTLESARWMKQEKDAEGVRVWTDLGAVEGLPQTASATVAIQKK
jgi:hypothetical protein